MNHKKATVKLPSFPAAQPTTWQLSRGVQWALRLEEAAQLAVCIGLFGYGGLVPYSLWWFWGLFLLPDVGMLGYVAGPRLGAWTYNTLHHKGLFAVLALVGVLAGVPLLTAAGLIGYGHAAFDRMMGYGLKLPQGFRFTHMGNIGRDPR